MAATTENPDTGASTGSRSAASRLLVIAGLTALVLVQPTLDLLGDSPATFRFHRVEGFGIVAFGLAIVVLAPLVVWMVGEGAIAVHERIGWLIHRGAVGALCGLLGVRLAKEIADAAVVHAIIGLGVAAAAAAAYPRFVGFAAWMKLLSIANPVFLGIFVVASPVSDAISRDTQAALEIEVDVDESLPSVLMIVFDELPTQSILSADQTVDAVRFPNLATFAEQSTWYRRFTAVSPFTQSSVPSLLDGVDPYGGPTWQDHPDSLFSLLAGTHHLVVSESITELCGLPECGVRPVPPPAAADVGEVVAPTTEIDTGPRWRRLVDETFDVWTDVVLPGTGDADEAFDDFEEEIVDVEPPADEPEEPVNANAGLGDDQIALARFLATQVVGQPERHRLFVDALRPTDEPFFGYLHLILPHQPWGLREDGTAYEVVAPRDVYENDNDDPWPVQVSRQRHLLQAEYADRLLGEILERLRGIGAYDDTIVVVAGDHGVAFEPGESSRRVSPANLEQITYTPLFVKAPGQHQGMVDDTNINGTDLTPTIADMLGLSLPWVTDGSPAGSSAIAARGSGKYVHSFTDAYSYEFLGVVDYDDDEAWPELVRGRFPPIAPDEDRLAGLYRAVPGSDLIGRSAAAVFGEIDGEASVDALDAIRDPDPANPLLGEVAGRVADAPDDATVVVAVNDRVVGLSPLYRRGGEDHSFVILLPADALDPDENTVRIGVRAADGTIAERALR